ncbi:lytic transglycosylase domain-containing protein [Rheinheimera sp.]|uniref:lytic transglycosylase domain-containing protein n=1 Tax=Rheinheimera sp. TaxID=1869214 RepID=UPI00307EC226
MTVQGISYAVLLIFFLKLTAATANPVSVYQYTDPRGTPVFADTAPKTTPFRVRNYDCAACGLTPAVNWADTPLFLTEYANPIRQAARQQQLEQALIRAVIHAESAFNATARSKAGALGLMQLMPLTAKALGVNNSLDTEENIQAGSAYLKQQLQRFDGELERALAAYNAGPGAVEHYKGIPPYAETQRYIARVKLLLQRYRQAIAKPADAV